METKRKFDRVDCKVKVFVGAEVVAGRIFFDAQDISVGGLYLTSDFILEEGDLVKVAFQLPTDKEPFVLSGLVQWTNLGQDPENPKKAGMGLKFVDASDADRKRLQTFVKERLG